jgi:ABC-2 type transport system permease protein
MPRLFRHDLVSLWLVQLLAVTRKEIRQTLRDRRVVAILLIVPAVQLGVFGAAVDFDVDRVPTVVVDHAQNADSRDFVSRLCADGTLIPRAVTQDDHDALRWIDEGTAAAALFIEPGFAPRARRAPSQVQIVVDGTDPNRGSIAAATVTRFARDQMQHLPAGSGAKGSRGVTLLPRVLHNPRLRTATYMVPGILAILLLLITMIVMAMGLTRERETGTLEQVMVTPIPPLVLMVGKLLPYLVAGLFDLTLGLVVCVHGFGVPINGNLGLVVLGTAEYLCVTLGTGLLISTMSRTQQQAFMSGFLVMLPAVLLSGVMTPLWGIPAVLEPVTWINPVRYYVEIIRGVLLRGSSFNELFSHFAVLAAMAVLVITVASYRFSRGTA